MSEALICDPLRTAIGRYAGGLATVRTDDLAAVPMKALMERNPGVDWERVDDVYYGNANHGTTEGIGLDDYLKSLGDVTYGEGLHDDIAAQLTSTATAIASLEDPLASFVVEQQAASFEVYAELQALVVLLKVDMMSSLGVLITYQDNDGD